MSATSIINESDQNFYFVTSSGVTVMGRTKTYDTYEQMLADKTPAKFGWVLDATGDETVDVGAAFYTFKDGKWQKLYESEAMDNENFGRPEGYDELVGTVNGLVIRVDSLANSKDLENHILNNTVHVTEEERVVWNSKVDSIPGKSLSTEDYTSEEKEKLAQLENYNDTSIRTAIENLDDSKADTSHVLDIQSRMGTLEENTSESLRQQQEIVDQNTTKVHELTISVRDIENVVASHETEIANLSNKTNFNTTNIDANKLAITNLNNSVEQHNNTINDIKALIQSQQDTITVLTDWKQSHTNEVSGIWTSITENSRAIISVTSRIEGVETSLSSYAERLAKVEEEVLGASQALSELEEIVGE